MADLVRGMDKENRSGNTRPSSRNSRKDGKEEIESGREVFQRTLNVER